MDHVIGGVVLTLVLAGLGALIVLLTSHPKHHAKHHVAVVTRFSQPATKPATAAYSQEVSSTLVRHFERIENGDYVRAWRDLVGQTTYGGKDQWVSENRRDKLRVFNLRVATRVVREREAKASIRYFRTYEDGGCQLWSGYWSLVKSQSRWLISYAEIKPRECA